MGVVELFFAIFSSATINYNLRGSTFQEKFELVGLKTSSLFPRAQWGLTPMLKGKSC